MEPDYLGLGVSQVNHPYQLKDPTASAMIDMVYATKQFCEQINGLQYNDQLYIAGYSEGGYATLAAVKEIEENYPDINITMSFPMAGAYDMSGTMVDLMLSKERYVNPYYLPYVLLSYIEISVELINTPKISEKKTIIFLSIDIIPYCLYVAFILSEEEKYYYIKGDINLDNQLDMLDLIDIKFNVKNSSSISTLEFWFSDFNNDGLLNMFDIYTFINKVLEN